MTPSNDAEKKKTDFKDIIERQQQKMFERSQIRHLELKKQETIEFSMNTRLAYEYGKTDVLNDLKERLENRIEDCKKEIELEQITEPTINTEEERKDNPSELLEKVQSKKDDKVVQNLSEIKQYRLKDIEKEIEPLLHRKDSLLWQEWDKTTRFVKVKSIVDLIKRKIEELDKLEEGFHYEVANTCEECLEERLSLTTDCCYYHQRELERANIERNKLIDLAGGLIEE